MKLRFRDGRTNARTNGRTDEDIEALADAMRALKNESYIKASNEGRPLKLSIFELE